MLGFQSRRHRALERDFHQNVGGRALDERAPQLHRVAVGALAPSAYGTVGKPCT